ncbi:MAG TPA: hypothetical protein DD733_05085 [Clostridiales bacterium]|nr:hypothetical protein [Eubacteriales bacterium]HBR31437.1 hypothetical protein [Clostridiales bacterium]
MICLKIRIDEMTASELMIKTNHHLIKGGEMTEIQKQNIVRQLTAARTTPEQAKRFYTGVKFPNNTDENGRQMYPLFFIPPYNNGTKYKTIFNQTPKTHILSANMYELEILRLLHLFASDDPEVKSMIGKTLSRLKTTCFGNEDDGVGECFDTSLIMLRFLATVAPYKKEWIQSRIDNYNRHYGNKKRLWFSKWYFWLCLSELPFELAKNEIEKYKDEMLNWLSNKSCVMNSDDDKMIHLVLFCILRNALAKYPEYAYIKDRQPYIKSPENGRLREKDGRQYFDMSKES